MKRCRGSWLSRFFHNFRHLCEVKRRVTKIKICLRFRPIHTRDFAHRLYDGGDFFNVTRTKNIKRGLSAKVLCICRRVIFLIIRFGTFRNCHRRFYTKYRSELLRRFVKVRLSNSWGRAKIRLASHGRWFFRVDHRVLVLCFSFSVGRVVLFVSSTKLSTYDAIPRETVPLAPIYVATKVSTVIVPPVTAVKEYVSFSYVQ